MNPAPDPAPLPAPGVAAELDLHTLHLDVAGLRLDLDFGPGHETLALETARLWKHLEAEPGSPAAASRRTYLAPPADARAAVLRLAAAGSTDALGPLLARPDAVVVLPGPGAAYAVSGDVTREVINRLLGDRILLHAGAVVHAQLGVVVVVGASGAGKSTATLALGADGTYLTDELAIIDPENRALSAYPKPVSRVVPDGDATAGRTPGMKRDTALDELGLTPASGAVGVDLLVLLDRVDDSVAVVERVPLARALLSLVEQSSSLWAVPHGLAVLAGMLSEAGGALRARYTEATQLAGLLAACPPPLVESWEEILPRGGQAPGASESFDPTVVVIDDPAPGTLSLAPFAQAIAVEDGLVVLAEGRASHLTGLGTVIWEEVGAAGAVDQSQIEQKVVEFAGPHPDSTAMVAAAVDTLVEDGWILRG